MKEKTSTSLSESLQFKYRGDSSSVDSRLERVNLGGTKNQRV